MTEGPYDDLKDLRGVEHRYVERGDAVIITGAEYLKKGRRLLNAECEIERLRAKIEARVWVVFSEARWPGESGYVVAVYASTPDLDVVAREHDEDRHRLQAEEHELR